MNSQTSFFPGGLRLTDFPVLPRSVTLEAGTYAEGTVLGKVTGGNYKVSEAAAADGSAVAVAVLPFAVDASAGATAAVAWFTGHFADDQLSYGAGHNIDSVNEDFIGAGVSISVQTRR